ncbi:MAG: hypothetical protein D6729_07970, partial [Deltaproteobacteria bacterium]
KTGSERREVLPFVTLASTDPVEKVRAFYKKALKGWKYSSEYGGMYHLFWKGKEEDKAIGAATVPTVVISEAKPSAPHLRHVKGVKTEIQIYYGKKAKK